MDKPSPETLATLAQIASEAACVAQRRARRLKQLTNTAFGSVKVMSWHGAAAGTADPGLHITDGG